MKRLIPLTILFFCISCLTEESADPGKGKTFFKYFNGGYDDQAQAFDETPDHGYVILATTQITDNNAVIQQTKIKLIKTDRYGNRTWQKLFPEFTDSDPSYYKGRAMVVELGGAGEVTGFTIVGDSIDATNGKSYLYVLKTTEDGTKDIGKALKEDNLGNSLAFLQGTSIVKDGDGYLVLGAKTDNASEDMVLARLFNDLTLDWVQDYGSGKTTGITGLFKDTQTDEIYWGGTVKLDGDETTDIRFVKTESDNAGSINNDNFGDPSYNEETGSMCYSDFFIPIFHIVGTTDILGSKDIFYKKVSTTGSEVEFPDNSTTVIIGDGSISEEGNAICDTDDGGTIIIGTSGLDDEQDYYLVKLNYFGEILWSKIFGSEKADRGVSIKQVSDGSYVILGTTVLGGLNTIMLTKRDSKGNIE